MKTLKNLSKARAKDGIWTKNTIISFKLIDVILIILLFFIALAIVLNT